MVRTLLLSALLSPLPGRSSDDQFCCTGGGRVMRLKNSLKKLRFGVLRVRQMTSTQTRLWTVEEYHRMAETGIIGSEERVELIEGQIIKMSPQLPPHATAVNCASDYLRELLAGRVTVRVQLPVTLKLKSAPESEPEPDIAIVQPPTRRYRDHHPSESEIFLVVVVADTTLETDRKTKATAYAKAQIADYWIIDVKQRRVFVLRNPGQETYEQEAVLDQDATITPLAFPNLAVEVEQLLP